MTIPDQEYYRFGCCLAWTQPDVETAAASLQLIGTRIPTPSSVDLLGAGR